MLSNQTKYSENSYFNLPATIWSSLLRKFHYRRNNRLHIYRNLDGFGNKIKFVLFLVFSHPLYLLGIFIHLPLFFISVITGLQVFEFTILALIWPLIPLISISSNFLPSMTIYGTDLSFVASVSEIFYFSFISFFLLGYITSKEISWINTRELHLQFKISIPVMQFLSVWSYLGFILPEITNLNTIYLAGLTINIFSAFLIYPLTINLLVNQIIWMQTYFTILCLFLLYTIFSSILLSISSSVSNRIIDNDTENTMEHSHKSISEKLDYVIGSFVNMLSSGYVSIRNSLKGLITKTKNKTKKKQLTVDLSVDAPVISTNLEPETKVNEKPSDQPDQSETKFSNKPKIESKLLSKTHFVVDGSNICWADRDTDEGPDIGRLPRLCLQLKKDHNAKMEDITIYVSAAFRHQIVKETDIEIFDLLLSNKTIKQAPAGEDDDIFIIQMALSNPNNSKIISNDLFRDNYQNFNGLKKFIKNNRVSVSWDDMNKLFIFGSNI